MNFEKIFGWNKTSYMMMSGFALLIFLIGYIWWPLLEEYISSYDPNYSFWVQFDWLLLGIFLVMSLLIMYKADLKKDFPIILIGLAGGFVIESWGTQTNLWVYYTFERPPLWIIPAWPIASLAIDRLFQFLQKIKLNISGNLIKILYWVIFSGFMALMIPFIFPTLGKSLTIMALALCVFLIFTPVDHKAMLFTFIAGSLLGYFLELWGTTRLCWIYYTLETPPIFAVFAHGMAAVAFWRVNQLMSLFTPSIIAFLRKKMNVIAQVRQMKSD
jgi:hypothetical protein